VGLLLIHVSVNTLNEYFDFKAGIDLRTVKTPFSGGSGVLPAGLLKPSSVLRLGIACFLLASLIGVYFVIVVGVMLLPVLVLGAFFTLLYSNLLVRVGLSEVSAGLGMGLLPVLGAYYVHAGFYGLNAFLAAVPSCLLVFNLLLLNEFPDVEADEAGGRRNLVMVLGWRGAAALYGVLTFSVYVFLAICVLQGLLPSFILLGFLTLPFAFQAVRNSLTFNGILGKLLPALKMNVIVVLATQALMVLGFILPRALGF
jgi:1,4-dihydroxy-2-naphthoate octaprenyltransferase